MAFRPQHFLCLLLGLCWLVQPYRVASVRSVKAPEPEEVEWHGSYGECSVQCGAGVRALQGNSVECKTKKSLWRSAKTVARELCETSAELPGTQACSSVTSCEWQVAAPPIGHCGWSAVTCAPKWGAPDDALMEYCEQAHKQKILPSKETFISKHGMVNDGCKASLQSICTVVLNQPAVVKDIIGSSSLKVAKAKAQKAVAGCADADVIVFTTQEMTGLFANMFDSFAEDLATLADGAYEKVAHCGGEMSAGVAVLSKRDLRKFFAPVRGQCSFDTDLYGAKRAYTNTKGTAFLELFTVIGPLIAASTHGTRGGVESDARVKMVDFGAKEIMSMNPSVVAWGGDFNMRTPITKDHEVVALGTTHPPDASGNDTHIDLHADLLTEFNPKKAHAELAATPDVLGTKDGRSLTMQDVLREASAGMLTEVPEIRNLCPSYQKKAKYGAGKYEKTDRVRSLDGTITKKGWRHKDGQETIEEWQPKFACQAPGSSSVEYYASPFDGKTEWPHRAPSWTERVVVLAGAEGNRCQPPQKVLTDHDHDTLYVRCDLP